jgi:hypothetical protein
MVDNGTEVGQIAVGSIPFRLTVDKSARSVPEFVKRLCKEWALPKG